MNKPLSRIALLCSFLGSATAFAQSAGLTATKGSDEAPHFYGLRFDLGIYDGTGLNSVGHNYRNDLSFYFEPSWDIGRMYLRNTPFKTLTLAGRFILTQNLSGTDEGNFTGRTNAGPAGTCSNLDPSANGGLIDPTQVQYCNPAPADRRTDYSDVWLTLRLPAIYTIPKLGVRISPSLRFIFPASAQSRFAGMITSITPMIGLGRGFWKGRLRAGFSFGVNKFFHTHTNPGVNAANLGGTAASQGSNYYDGAYGAGLSNFYADPSRSPAIGGTNPNFSLLSIVSGGVQFSEKWSFDALYIVVNTYGYSQPCDVSVNGVMVDVCRTGDAVAGASGSATNRPGRRDSQVLWAVLNYQVLDWMGLSVAWINWTPLQKPDSTYRQGVFSTDYNSFTSISLGTTISIEGAIDKIRASRKKKPITTAALSN